MKKNILITGAGTGLGKEAAIELAKRGHIVIATTKYEEEVTKLKEISHSKNLNIDAFKLDILSDTDKKLLQDIEFDILINNAAIGDSGSVCEANIDRFKEVFEVNVFNTISITQIAMKKFMKKKEGKIIFISSLAGRISIPFLSPYCASKFAIESIAESLRAELKLLDNINIKVTLIEPGMYKTGFNKENIEKKYTWMEKESYFTTKIPKLKNIEKKIMEITEQKKFKSIMKQYIRAVEDVNLKHRYTAPKFQAFLTQLGRIIGL